MDKQEFFLLIPAIIYGVALVDLLKVFKNKKTYWEVVAWGSVMMLFVIITWLELFEKLDTVAANKWYYILLIGKAIIVAQIAAIITPEEKHMNTKDYFISIKQGFFLLIAALTIFNFVLQEFYYDDHRPWTFRLSIIAIALACAFFNKMWIRVATLIIVAAILIQILIFI
jgi:hypothetical protein